MPISLIEVVESREGEVSPDPSAQLVTRKYLLTGTDDELVARQYIEASLSAFLNGQSFNNYRLVPRGAGLWDVTANYGKKKNAGVVTLNFDTGNDKVKVTRAAGGSAYYPAYVGTYGLVSATPRGSGTNYEVNDILTLSGGTLAGGGSASQVKVLTTGGGVNKTLNTLSVQTVGNYTVPPVNPVTLTGGSGSGGKIFAVWTTIGGTPGPVKDFKGALGIKTHQGEHKAEGIDDEVPAFGFTVNITFGPQFPLTSAFVDLCDALAWHVNSAPISPTIAGITRTYQAGELLFQGATGLQKTGGSGIANYPDWEGEVTLKFAKQPNIENETIAGVPGVTKKGWDYLEIISEEAVDTAASDFIPKVTQVNVNQVKLVADLSPLFPSLPTISSFTPTTGSVATIVTITGTNYFGVTSVLFNGVPAPYYVISATSIQAAVPATATTGKITVKASGGSVLSATDFTVT